jgi:predicted naringenin-chalcone synthase
MSNRHTNLDSAYLSSLALAVPGCAVSQKESLAFLLEHYAGILSSRHRAFLKRILTNPSIRMRYFAFTAPEVLLGETPDQRIARFQEGAVELAGRAVRKAMTRANLTSGDISGLVVNTCTGYLCPGLSSYLIEELGLPENVRAYDLVGSGCGGALPNLQTAGALVREAGGPVISVAVEVCSATFQMADELSLVLSNALFSDGAAAAVLTDRPGGWRLAATASRHLPGLREAIRYVHRDGQLFNQLSTELPALIGEAVPSMLHAFLEEQGLAVEEIRHWAMHAGGEKIINVLQEKLGLSDQQLQPTRTILADYGNLSSPSALFVLQAITAGGVQPGDRCLLLAFGAGLSVHVMLLIRES